MRKIFVRIFVPAVIAVAGFTWACSSSNGPTESTPLPAPPVAAAPAATTPSGTPTAADPANPETYTIDFGNNASWDFTNKTGITQQVYAYYTSFEDQVTAIAVKSAQPQNGGHFADSFNQQCVQLDITQEPTVAGGPGGRPL